LFYDAIPFTGVPDSTDSPPCNATFRPELNFSLVVKFPVLATYSMLALSAIGLN